MGRYLHALSTYAPPGHLFRGGTYIAQNAYESPGSGPVVPLGPSGEGLKIVFEMSKLQRTFGSKDTAPEAYPFSIIAYALWLWIDS